MQHESSTSLTYPGSSKSCFSHVPVFTIHNEVVKVMFLQVCVCPQGGCLVLGGAWSGGSALGGFCSWGCLVPGGAWSQVGSALGDDWSRGVGIPACTEADPPAEMATAADGMHPTGMHYCWQEGFLNIIQSFTR